MLLGAGCKDLSDRLNQFEMNGLAEIEKAADALSSEEKQHLLKFIQLSLAKERSSASITEELPVSDELKSMIGVLPQDLDVEDEAHRLRLEKHK